jgi:hypothetical protein
MRGILFTIQLIVFFVAFGFSIVGLAMGLDRGFHDAPITLMFGAGAVCLILFRSMRHLVDHDQRRPPVAVNQGREGNPVAGEERELIERLWAGLEKMERRIENLETILMERQR